jgi:CheY-like chemotaxis protein
MTQPLALVYYRNFMPGSQLPSRLEDLDYRVEVAPSLEDLATLAVEKKPFLIIVEVTEDAAAACAALEQLRREPAVKHVPVLAYTSLADDRVQSQVRNAGATVVASDVAVNAHLRQLLNRVLQIE